MPTVLVADDEPDIREFFVDVLEDKGYDVIQADNGKTAVELACLEHPDLILLDVMMPELDGFQVLAALRENARTYNIPVVILTAVDAVEGERYAMLLNVEHYLTKPCDPEVIEATIRVCLRESESGTLQKGDASGILQGGIVKEAIGNEAIRNEAIGNEAGGNEAIGNEAIGNDAGGNEAIGNDAGGNEAIGNEAGRGTVIATGGRLRQLDESLGSGLSLGSLTLIEGSPGTGKSVLCQHLIFGALDDGHGVVCFTSEEDVPNVAVNMSSVGLDVSKHLGAHRLCIYPLGESDPDQYPERLLGTLSKEITGTSGQYDFIVVDAITNLVGNSADEVVFQFFKTCKQLCVDGKTIVVVANPSGFDSQSKAKWRTARGENRASRSAGELQQVRLDREMLFTRLRGLSDTVINLRSESIANRSVHVMEVRKGDKLDLSIEDVVTFVVEPGIGMRLMPVSRTRL